MKILLKKYLNSGVNIEQHGIETAFDLEQDINEIVLSGCDSGDIFVSITNTQKLNDYIGPGFSWYYISKLYTKSN